MNLLARIFRRDALAAPEPPVKAAAPKPVTSHPSPVTAAQQPAPAPGLARIIRPQALNRWSLPMLGSLTPQYIEMLLRSAMAGSHQQQWELFDLMRDTWPELASCCAEITEGVMCREFTVAPFTEEDEDAEATESAEEKRRLVSAALRTMRPDIAGDENDLQAMLRDITDGWFVGVSVQEVLWETRGLGALGTCIVPKATVWVHPSNYGFSAGALGLRTNPNGAGLLPSGSLHQSPTGHQSLLHPFPEHKFLLGIHKAKSGSVPAGALLRPLCWWWCAANFSADWLLRLAEIFGLPFRWAQFDPNAPQDVIDNICSMLQNMGSAGWAAFPTGTTLEMKEPAKGGSDHSPQGELLDRADRYARLLTLGQTQSGGKGSEVGGQAFGSVEEGVKAQRIQSCAAYVAGVIETQLAPMILALNYGPGADECPRIAFTTTEEEDLAALATTVSTMEMAGYDCSKLVEEKFGDSVTRKAGPALDEQTAITQGAPATGVSDVQATALNGAQVTALADLAEQVANGQLPPESARSIAFAAFPMVPETTINRIFGALRTFEPAKELTPPSRQTADPMEAKQLRRLRRVLSIQDDALFAKGLQAIATAS